MQAAMQASTIMFHDASLSRCERSKGIKFSLLMAVNIKTKKNYRCSLKLADYFNFIFIMIGQIVSQKKIMKVAIFEV